jgi:FKBP-type peptidyl-prolyl cis-trans isomerase FklB
MKKILMAATVFISLNAIAQKKPAPVKKPVIVSSNVLKNLTDSASYAIGVSVANFYAQQGMKKLNATMISKAITDATSGKKMLLNDNECNTVVMKFINQASEAKAKPTIAAGQKFLVANKTKAGVKTTSSGLQYEVIVEGTGPKPAAADSVTCHYAGTLLNGTEFDNSFKRGAPITFSVTGVIRGWTEALQLMPEGSKYKLYIPHELAYGTNDNGNIPAGSMLIFEVELLKVIGKNTKSQ